MNSADTEAAWKLAERLVDALESIAASLEFMCTEEYTDRKITVNGIGN